MLSIVLTMGAFLVAAVAAWLLAGPAIPWLRRLQPRARPREDVPKSHAAKAGTPSMGGLFLAPAALIGMLLAAWRPEAWGIAAAIVLFGLMGFADDYLKIRSGRGHGLKARHKLVVQALLGVGLMIYAVLVLDRGRAVALPGGTQIDLGWAIYIFGALAAMAVTNAVNLTDGLDGLAAGVSIPPLFALMALTLFACLMGPADWPAYAIAAAALAGACAGFLKFNRKPAKVWMGDTGSLALGGGFTALALFSGMEWLLLLAGLVFVVEALSVVIQVICYQTTGRRIFRMSPLHHHFELSGHTESQVVTGLWIASVLCAALGLAVGYVSVFAGL